MPIRVQTPRGMAEFPEGTDPQVIEAALREQFPTPSASHPAEPAETDVSRFGPLQGLLAAQAEAPARRAAAAVDLPEAAPMAGGMAGASLGGPMGAAAGGAVGTLIRDLFRANRGDVRTPRTAPEAATNVGVNAAGQAALTAGGDLASRGLSRGAERLYRGLLKPSKALRQEFGDVTPALLAAKRPITKTGVTAADAAVDASKAQADALIAAAPASLAVTPQRVVQEFQPVMDAVKARVDAGVVPRSELQQIVKRVHALQTSGGPQGFAPVRAQTLKRTAQEAATGAYHQMQRGGAKMLSTEDLLDAATARGFKGGLEDLIPGVGPQNAQTQQLLGQLRALEDALGRTGNHLPFGSVSDLAALAAGSISPVLGVAGKASTMAGPGSKMAIGLHDAAKVPSAQALRALALMRLLQAPDAQETTP